MGFNKIDLIEKNGIFKQLKSRFPEAVFISAIRNMGVVQFKQKVISYYDEEFITTNWHFPIQQMHDRELLLRNGVILQEQMIEDSHLWVVSRIPKAKYEKLLKENGKLKEFIVENEKV